MDFLIIKAHPWPWKKLSPRRTPRKWSLKERYP